VPLLTGTGEVTLELALVLSVVTLPGNLRACLVKIGLVLSAILLIYASDILLLVYFFMKKNLISTCVRPSKSYCFSYNTSRTKNGI
jgi:hypothetical protein